MKLVSHPGTRAPRDSASAVYRTMLCKGVPIHIAMREIMERYPDAPAHELSRFFVDEELLVAELEQLCREQTKRDRRKK